MFSPAPQTKGLMHVKWIRAGVALEKSPTLLVALRRSGMTSSNLFPGFHYTCGQTWYSTKPGSELSDGPSCSTTGSDLKKKNLKINKKTNTLCSVYLWDFPNPASVCNRSSDHRFSVYFPRPVLKQA